MIYLTLCAGVFVALVTHATHEDDGASIFLSVAGLVVCVWGMLATWIA